MGLLVETLVRVGLGMNLLLSLKIAQKPYIMGSLGPKTLKI